MLEQVFKLFVSSPGDASDERRRVDMVVERLNTEFQASARFEAIRWETAYYSAHETFQKQIPEAAECDVVIAIFRARIGSTLPDSFEKLLSGEPYPSGTAYEVLSAIQARQNGKGVPDVYVFRYPKPPFVALEDPQERAIRDQWQKLKSFFDTWFHSPTGQFVAAFQEFSSTDDFAEKLEDCLRQWLSRKGFLSDAAYWDRTTRGSPFRGLESFDADHRSVFFGRSNAINGALARLREVGVRGCGFLLVVGASGSGKSSLLRAGLLPRVVSPGAIPEIDLWKQTIFSPAADLWRFCAEALFKDDALGPELRQSDFNTPALLAELMAASSMAALAPIRAALERAAAAKASQQKYDAPRSARILIALDQMERLFTEVEAKVAHSFAELMGALVERGFAYIICALRSDAYPQFQSFPELMNLKTDGATFDLLAPSRTELEEIITRPVAACRPPLEFERKDGRSLADVLVDDARGGDALPLLQMTLEGLFLAESSRRDGVLRFVDYPGMGLAVTHAAEAAIGKLHDISHSEIVVLVTQMISDVVTDPITREPVPVIKTFDRAAFEGDSAERKALVDALMNARLLTAEGVDGVVMVRPVHEALLRTWPLAAGIVKEYASLIRVRYALEPIVREWLSAPTGVKSGYLNLPWALLSGAQDLVNRLPDSVTSGMRKFVLEATEADERRRAAERENQERRIRDAEALAAARRRTLTFSLIGLVIALVMAATAGVQWYNAVRAQQDALTDLYLQESAASHSENVNLENAKLLTGLAQSANVASLAINALIDAKSFRIALPIAESFEPVLTGLMELEPNDAQLGQQAALVEGQIGDSYVGLGQGADAQSAYKRAITNWDTVIGLDSSNAQWPLIEVVDLTKLAGTGSDPKANLSRALDVLQKLSSAGRLPDYAKNWSEVIKTSLARLSQSP